MGIDLGTYHVRVRFTDGRGFIMQYGTGARYTGGRYEVSPLDAMRAPPIWTSEQDLADSVLFNFTEGNASCDCNKLLYLADAAQEERPDDPPCGETLELAELTLIRPDGTERPLLEPRHG